MRLPHVRNALTSSAKNSLVAEKTTPMEFLNAFKKHYWDFRAGMGRVRVKALVGGECRGDDCNGLVVFLGMPELVILGIKPDVIH